MPGRKMSKYMAKGGKYMSKMAKGGKYMSKMAKGGKYMSKMAKGGVKKTGKTMTVAQIRAAANKKGYKLVKKS
tara:strand:+ start:283 stop:501 length:219 start_codon:yes stop_codon:yes gene_type:complete